MGKTPTLQLPYPDPTTKIDIAAHIQELAEAIDIALQAAPPGIIVPFKGAAIPAGWHLCDGTGGTPDLRNKFVMGAGTGHTAGSASGSDTVSLTTLQLPSHTHTGGKTGSGGGSHTHGTSTAPASTDLVTADVGHTHTFGTSKGNGDRHAHIGPGVSAPVKAGGSMKSNDFAVTILGAGAHNHTLPAIGVTVAAGGSLPSHTHTATTAASGSATPTAFSIVPAHWTLVYIMKV